VHHGVAGQQTRADLKGHDRSMTYRQGSVTVVLLAALLGAMVGIGVFTFGYAQGGAYMTNDPKACANCHVMHSQFSGWMKSSHRKAAVCNDCHTPPGLIPKYFTKALNGLMHSWAFTSGWFPDQIYITQRNANVTEQACLKCHEEIVSSLPGVVNHRNSRCTVCHAGVGH
jgi:cytochrome c nitrite reductase small subunit